MKKILTLLCLLSPLLAHHIEKATLDHNIDRIAEVINLAYQRQPFNHPNALRITPSQLIQILNEPEKSLFLLIHDDQISGTLLLHHQELSLFSIHPALQGKKLGSHLLHVAEQEAFEKYPEVYLKVIPLFQEKLIAYYQQQGYHPTCKEPLSPEKFDRIQPQYWHLVYALKMSKISPLIPNCSRELQYFRRQFSLDKMILLIRDEP